MREEFYRRITQCFDDLKAIHKWELPADFQFLVQYPKEQKYGDISTNIALVAGSYLKISPRNLAEIFVEYFKKTFPEAENIDVAGPGFINFTLSNTFWHKILNEIVKTPDYGRKERNGPYLQVEFVSANPTGPLNVVNARAAALGDTLCRMMRYVGYKVDAEYLVNDAGTQIDLLGESILARYLELLGKPTSIPEGGYPGEYIKDIAKKIMGKNSSLANPPKSLLIQEGVKEIVSWQKEDLEKFRVKFDRWFYQTELTARNLENEVLNIFKAKNAVYEKEKALWLKTTKWSDDQDRVLIKSNGEFTYFLSDIAYHYEKFNRGYEKVIDIWGPDHHGHIARMKAAMSAIGIDPKRLIIIIAQMVTLKRGGQKLKMSKREGEFITLKELVDEIGVDAARCFFILRRFDSHLDFDIDLAKEQSEKNPVYYLQYAYARVQSIYRKARTKKVPLTDLYSADPSLLNEKEEINLIKQLRRFPEVVQEGVESLEPHRLAFYLHDLCALFHNYYYHHRILSNDIPLTLARLKLVKGFEIILKKGLELMGIEAPDSM